MTIINKKNFYLLIIAAIILFHILLSAPLSQFDKVYNDQLFRMRGEVEQDSSIITLFIDDAITDSLGRAPLKWVYYSLLINALSQLEVKAIGLDVVFDSKSPDYPSQTGWILSSVRKSGKVCLGGIFNQIEKHLSEEGTDKKDSATIPLSKNIFYSGKNMEVPFSNLLNAAAGFGHLNFEQGISKRNLPLFIVNNDTAVSELYHKSFVPSLSLELARVYFDLPADSIITSQAKVILKNGINSIEIPVDESLMPINYCGGVNSLNSIAISDFLHLYRAYSSDKKVHEELARFKDKIVLIGMLGTRNTEFASNPFADEFPLIGIHANALDTILRERFISKTPYWVTLLSSVFLITIIFFFSFKKQILFSRLVISGGLMILIYVIASVLLFTQNIALSGEPLFVILLSVFAAGVYQVNKLQSHTRSIEKEKLSIEALLNKSRQKIQKLEESLSEYKNNLGNGTSSEIIQTYLDEVSEIESRLDEVEEVKPVVDAEIKNFHNIIHTKNSKLVEIINLIKKIAPTDATVLILGESGTGKELVAKAIHDLSDRKNENFITINCGALPESLLESELFGHEEGAFTGAKKMRKGFFETADKGTIFLDEITETSEMFQIKLLRVLQSGEFNRVGGTKTNKIAVRIIAASNKNIETLVREKKFREDLYYRLNVIKVKIPPLKSRKSDLIALTNYFLEKEGTSNIKLADSSLEAFLSYHWPGNIRQLENVIKRASILAKVDNSGFINLKYLPPEIIGSMKNNQNLEGRIFEKLNAKEFSHSAISETAAELGGLHRSTISEYIRGVFFREFCNNEFDFEKTVRSITTSSDENVKTRITNKLNEYITNLTVYIDREIPIDELKEKLGIKFKKMPNKYHPYLITLIEHYYYDENVIQNKNSDKLN
ncbi:MAG: sigma 54-interacting transcriptional regulator [Ignavibacteriales bacterium]|nr:MAG: sigma 54-interacting transcriptional regulator [Ignavibacteriales bacterium]